MSDLLYHASFSFVIELSNFKGGKEYIHQVLMEILNRQDNNYLSNRWGKWLNRDNSLICQYSGEPFGNLRFEDMVTITDDSISHKYVEYTNQKIMLPNILSYVYFMLFSVKAAEQLQGGYDVHSVKCEVIVDNNADVLFYKKYSPLAVDYSFLLKYSLDGNIGFRIEMESHNDIYVLFNRFYNLYKSDGSIAKPSITLIKDIFDQTYDAI